MPAVTIHLDAEDKWPELVSKLKTGKFIDARGAHLFFGGLPNGMKSGAPSLAIRLDLPDGRTVFAETSMSLFLNAADAFRTKYGAPGDVTYAAPVNELTTAEKIRLIGTVATAAGPDPEQPVFCLCRDVAEADQIRAGIRDGWPKLVECPPPPIPVQFQPGPGQVVISFKQGAGPVQGQQQ